MPQVYRDLAFTGGIRITSEYKRTDVDPIDSNYPTSKIDINRRHILSHGFNDYEAELQWKDRRTLTTSQREQISLDGGQITDDFGLPLEFAAVKLIWIHVVQAGPSVGLQVEFKYERYFLGPDGERYIYEPSAAGIEFTASSASATEGSITLTALGGAIIYDIVILGSTQED